jgi:hypothetical protein
MKSRLYLFSLLFSLVLLFSLAACVEQMQQFQNGSGFEANAAESSVSGQRKLVLEVTPSDAVITIEGKPGSFTNFPETRFVSGGTLPQGLYRVTVSREGHSPESFELPLYKDVMRKVDLRALPETEGTFVWKYLGPDAVFYDGIYFSEAGGNMNYDDAKRYCKDYSDMIRWRLPKSKELVPLKEKLFYDAEHFDLREFIFWTDDPGSLGGYNSVMKLRIRDAYNSDAKKDYLADVRCVASPGEISRFRSKPSVLLMERLDKDLKAICTFAEPEPVEPDASAPPKGEFETTAAYESRIRKLRGTEEKNYRAAWDAWRNRQAQQEKRCVSANEDLRLPAAAMNYYRSVFHFLYGSPEVVSVDYDADAQIFDVTLRAQADRNFTLPLRVPVKAAYAPDFKRILMANAREIEVNVRVDGEKFVALPPADFLKPERFVERYILKESSGAPALKAFIARFPNSSYQKEAEEKYYALARSSIDGLNGFIAAAPKSRLIPAARKDLAQLKDNERVYRQRQEAVARENAKQAEAARKSREENERRRSKAYADDKFIGQKVCRDAVTGFIFTTRYAVEAFVETRANDRIQLRIHDSHYSNNYYDGQIVWDHENNWRSCSY